MNTSFKVYDSQARKADIKTAYHMSLVKKAASELGIYELNELNTYTHKNNQYMVYELIYFTDSQIQLYSGEFLKLLHGMQLRLSYNESLNEVVTEVRHGFRQHASDGSDDLTTKRVKFTEWVLVGLGSTLMEKWGGILAYFAEREYPDIITLLRKQKVDSLFS